MRLVGGGREERWIPGAAAHKAARPRASIVAASAGASRRQCHVAQAGTAPLPGNNAVQAAVLCSTVGFSISVVRLRSASGLPPLTLGARTPPATGLAIGLATGLAIGLAIGFATCPGAHTLRSGGDIQPVRAVARCQDRHVSLEAVGPDCACHASPPASVARHSQTCQICQI